MESRLRVLKETAERLLQMIVRLQEDIAGGDEDGSSRTQLSVSYPAPVPVGVTDASSRISVSRPRRTATVTPAHGSDAISIAAARSIGAREHVGTSASFEDEDDGEPNDYQSRQQRRGRRDGDQQSTVSSLWTDGASRSSRVLPTSSS